MGQYYKFMNIDKKQVCERNRHGWKLMEHSYLGNDYCDDILRLLNNEWKGDRVLHVGDYAQPDDETTTQNKVKAIMKELNISFEDTLYNFCDTFDEVKSKSKEDIRYVYNLDKKEYVDLFKQPIEWCYHDDKFLGAVKINSFALLIGCGNGQGGGDYRCTNDNLVGYWVGDRFVSSSEPIKEYNDFNLRNEIYYEEKEYDGLIYYDNDKILTLEKSVFKKCLDDYNKYGHNISKLTFDSFGLTDEEIKILEPIFEECKNFKKAKEEDICL